MRFIVRIVDYHFGGHISYVRIIDRGKYILESEPKNATVFTSANEFAIIRDNLTKNIERQVTLENIVDDALMLELKRL